MGAAISVALCGHREHDPPCLLAPHHTRTAALGERVQLRKLFAVEPELESEVRRRIDDALRTSRLTGPDGVTTYWQLQSSQPGALAEQDRDHVGRLIAN